MNSTLHDSHPIACVYANLVHGNDFHSYDTRQSRPRGTIEHEVYGSLTSQMGAMSKIDSFQSLVDYMPMNAMQFVAAFP